MCGEHALFDLTGCTARGSSPHVRGAPCDGLGGIMTKRIIPACAGSTSGSPAPPAISTDHPRMCGEHMTWLQWHYDRLGSSPHVRGALAGIVSSMASQGIIPACAGSTSTASTKSSRPWDHPRMCGEHGNNSSSSGNGGGSSPHVRGAQHQRSTR